MEYEIVMVEEKWVSGPQIRTENKDGRAVRDIAALWEDFFRTAKNEQVHATVDSAVLGVYTDYESDEAAPYSYLAGCEVDSDARTEFPVRKIAAGKYAKYTAAGDMEKAVGEIWQAVWNAPYKRSYTSDFEEYIDMGTGNATLNIYIGIE
ncbi:MAG: GyrI-like domain-containing protein [Christensenellaceae bacterium]|jgi:predicted transcriptional regulator YdeE